MSDQKTTISVGFRSDTTGIDQASQKISRLKRLLDDTANSCQRLNGQGGGSFWGNLSDPSRQRVMTGGFMGGFGRGILNRGMAGGGAALAGLGMATGAIALIARMVSSAREYIQALDPLEKQLSMVTDGQSQFAGSIERTGEAIGKTKIEMVRLAQSYVALAGAQQGGIARQMNVAGLLAKGMGVDTGTMYSSMGSMAQMGAFGQYGGMRMERFAVMIADAVARGGMNGREGEVLSSIQSLMGSQLNVLTRMAPGSTDAMIGALTAMNASNRPGLMGMRGAGLLQQMNQGFMNPRGEFGEYFMYNALGGGDYFDFRSRLEKGIFGKGNLDALMGQFRKNFKNPKARYHAMSKILGISMDQAAAIDGLDLNNSDAFMSALDKATGGRKEAISPDKLGLMAQIFNSSGAQREALFKDARISGLAKEKGWTARTDINTVLAGIAKSGLKQTESEKMMTTLTTIDNSITKYGEKIVPKLTDILEGVLKITNKLVDEDDNLIMSDEQQKKVIDEIRARGLFDGAGDEMAKQWASKAKGTYEVGSQVVGGLFSSFDPIMEGIGNLFTELGKQLKLEVKVVDDRVAGDGNTVKAGR